MPGCFRGNEDGADPDKVSENALPHQDWREPPGYLGEAVRRAKRISSMTGQISNPMTEDGSQD